MSGIEFLLDTNVIIGLLKGNPVAIALADQVGLKLDKAAASQITRMEELLGYPGLADDEERAIRTFLAACQICMIDERIEAKAIELRRSGAFKLPDAIIAATAICGSLRLITLDKAMADRVQHFVG
jgi:predicted nucleic acid-binding protein